MIMIMIVLLLLLLLLLLIIIIIIQMPLDGSHIEHANAWYSIYSIATCRSWNIPGDASMGMRIISSSDALSDSSMVPSLEISTNGPALDFGV